MNLVSIETKICQQTFQPLKKITIEIPLEFLIDSVNIVGEEETIAILGKELYNILAENKQQ